MKTFQYTAKDRSGRTVVGVLDAATEADAAATLHQKDLIVLSVVSTRKKSLAGRDQRVKLDDLVVFSRQLVTLINAGIPVVQALGILADQVENPNFRQVVSTIREDIEGGMSFCDALAKHPTVFSELFINMARAGEASGMLDDVLDRLATYLEKTAALNRKVKSSLVYPTVVVTISFAITAFLLLKVVPTFKGIFDVLGGELPMPTRILIGVSDLLRQAFLFLVGSTIVLAFAFKRYISTEKGRYNFDAQKLKMLVLGPLMLKVAIAKFSRTFSTLVKSGVAVLNALDIVAKTSGNKVIEETVMNCRIAVRDGEPIARPLTKSGVFPLMVCRMIGIGEQTGKLEQMLEKIADFYDEQVDAAVSGLTSIIEPMVILFLGVVVGGIVISLFLPIFKITQLIAH